MSKFTILITVSAVLLATSLSASLRSKLKFKTMNDYTHSPDMFCDNWYIEYTSSYEIYLDGEYYLWEPATDQYYKWQTYNGEAAFYTTDERPIADSCLPGYVAPTAEAITSNTETYTSSGPDAGTSAEAEAETSSGTETQTSSGTEAETSSSTSSSSAEYHAGKSATSGSLYNGESLFDTTVWGIGEGMGIGTPSPNAMLFTEYANTQDGDWGSMNVDGHTMFAWANRWNIPVWGDRVFTNNHEYANTQAGDPGQENVFYSL